MFRIPLSFRQKKPKQKAIQKTSGGAQPEPPPMATSAFIETYPVYEPYVHIAIARQPETNQPVYTVIEPTLSEQEKELSKKIIEMLKIGLDVDVRTLGSTENIQDYLRKQVVQIMSRFGLKIRRETFDKLMYYVNRNLTRYGRIDPMMRDPMVEDISCDGPKIPIYIWHREYESIPSNVAFEDSDQLDRFILRMAYMSGRHVSVAQPLVDAGLPDGSRLQMSYSTEVTKKGSTFTIRKFKEDPLSIVDLIKYRTISVEIGAMLWYALENKSSVLLAGGTASGKTTSINGLAMFIRPESKVITIEDTPEINLPHENWIQSISRSGMAGAGEVSLFDLLKAAMRQRPDFIIVGEVRGAEAYTLFQALSTGHAGLSSIHADSVAAAFHRLTSDPMNIPKTLIPSVNYIVHQLRTSLEGRPMRRVTSVVEVVGLDTRTGEFITNEVFRYNAGTDAHVYSGRAYMLEKLARQKGLTEAEVSEELAKRRLVLNWMVSKNIRKYRDVAKVVRDYYADKEGLLKRIQMESY